MLVLQALQLEAGVFAGGLIYWKQAAAMQGPWSKATSMKSTSNPIYKLHKFREDLLKRQSTQQSSSSILCRL